MMSEIIPLLKKAEQNTCWANSRKEIKTFGTSAVSFRHFLRTLVDSKEFFFFVGIYLPRKIGRRLRRWVKEIDL